MSNCCGCFKKPEPVAEVEPPKLEVQAPVIAQPLPEAKEPERRKSFPEVDLNASSDFASLTGFQSVLKPARPMCTVPSSVMSVALSPLPQTKHKKLSVIEEEPSTPSSGIAVQQSVIGAEDVAGLSRKFWKRSTPKATMENRKTKELG